MPNTRSFRAQRAAAVAAVPAVAVALLLGVWVAGGLISDDYRTSTSAGPVLRVRLTPGDTSDAGADGAIDLGALKGNRGDQQHHLPHGTQLAGQSVVIWCRAFSAPFGSAPLPEDS